MGGPGGLGGLGGLNVSKQFAIKNAGETNSIKHDWLDERSSMGKKIFTCPESKRQRHHNDL